VMLNSKPPVFRAAAAVIIALWLAVTGFVIARLLA
jgi:hypothetical protein